MRRWMRVLLVVIAVSLALVGVGAGAVALVTAEDDVEVDEMICSYDGHCVDPEAKPGEDGDTEPRPTQPSPWGD